MDLEDPKHFARLFSVLQYLFCRPPKGDGDKDDLELFGEGFSWAGCLLIHCLGDRELFKLGDFCYHIQKLNNFTPVPISKEAAMPKTKKEQPLLANKEIDELDDILAFLKNVQWVKGHTLTATSQPHPDKVDKTTQT